VVRGFACGDERQAVLWLVRVGQGPGKRTLDRSAEPVDVRIDLPGLNHGDYEVTTWNTEEGREEQRFTGIAGGEWCSVGVRVRTDLAVAIRPAAKA
jgi:mannan endo-1,4-beta-mannosidase